MHLLCINERRPKGRLFDFSKGRPKVVKGIEEIYLLKPEKRMEYLLNKYGADKIKFEPLFVSDDIRLTPQQYLKYGKDMPLEILVAAVTNNFESTEGINLLLQTTSVHELLSKLDILPKEYFDGIKLRYFHLDYVDNYMRKVSQSDFYRVFQSKDAEDIRKLFSYSKIDFLIRIMLHDYKGRHSLDMMFQELSNYMYDNDRANEAIVLMNILLNKYHDNTVIMDNIQHLTEAIHRLLMAKIESDSQFHIYEFNYALESVDSRARETLAKRFFPVFRKLFLPLYRVYPERFRYRDASVSYYYFKERRKRYINIKKAQLKSTIKGKVGL